MVGEVGHVRDMLSLGPRVRYTRGICDLVTSCLWPRGKFSDKFSAFLLSCCGALEGCCALLRAVSRKLRLCQLHPWWLHGCGGDLGGGPGPQGSKQFWKHLKGLSGHHPCPWGEGGGGGDRLVSLLGCHRERSGAPPDTQVP